MNNFGRQTVTPGTTNKFIVGQNWEYIQIINESPYILTALFEGIGSMDIPSWHKEDVQVNKLFDGQLFLMPSNITQGQASPQSTIVSVNAFSPGELETPKSVALTRMGNNSLDIFAELYAFVEWTVTTLQTITLPNVAGKTLFLDNFDITDVATATSNNLAIVVNALTAGLDYNYFSPASASVGATIDHVPFGLNRGVQQAANTAITLTGKLTVASFVTNLNAHYHYERNF